ncbi:glycosyltransferase family 24 protein [Chiua virens]|nr:glycosyltransferase family 24 protein [Chiua virens]
MSLARTLFALTGIVLSVHGASPPVTVSLRSSFTATDPLLEAFETVAMEDPSVLFPILSAFSLTERPTTPLQAHTAVFSSASDHMHSAALNSARVRLALHAVTPRLAASAEYYDRHVAGLADSPECASWVDWYGQVVCDVDTLLQLSNSQDDDTAVEKPKSYPLDHVHRVSSSREGPRHTAIHFADPTAPSFRPLHETLLSLAPKVEYVLRWAHGTADHGKDVLSTHLSGYGVSLDLKKMDYLVLDDRDQPQEHTTSQDSSQLVEHRDQVSPEETLACIFDSLPYIDEEAEMRAKNGEPLTSIEIADLGAKAVQFVVTFSDKPRTESPYDHQCWDNQQATPFSDVELYEILTNSFPLYTTSLARKIDVSEELKEEIYYNWAKVPQGANMAWVNGRVLHENEGSAAGIFGLLRTLQRERTLVKSLVDLGFTSEQAIELLTHPVHSTSQQSGSSASTTASARHASEDPAPEAGADETEAVVEEKKTFSLPPKYAEYLEGLVDASDRQEGGGVVLYWNDLAADARYASSSPSLQVLLRAHAMSLFSPMLRIRQNLVNVIFVIDLSQTRSLSLLNTLSENFVARGYPVRWGFVPEVEGDSLRMARLIYYIHCMHGRDRMIAFIQSLIHAHAERRLSSQSWQIVQETFESLSAEHNFTAVAQGDVPVIDETTGEDIIARSQKYVRRLGLGVQATAGKGYVFVNGRDFSINDNLFQQMATEVTAQLQILQEMVYTGVITDDDIPLMPTFFYDLPSTLRRRNPYIHVNSPSGHGQKSDRSSSLQMFNLPELFSKSGFHGSDGSFVIPSRPHDLMVTVYVIADFDMHEGLELAKEALKFMMNSHQSRLSFIQNPEAETSRAPYRDVEYPSACGSERHHAQQPFTVTGDTDSAADIADLQQASRLIARYLGLQPGQRAILINGRLVGPFDANSEFIAEDFEMLECFEIKQHVGRVADAINEIFGGDYTADAFKRADLISFASSIIYADQQPDPSEAGLFDTAPKPRTRNYRFLSSVYTKLAVGDPSAAQSHIAVLVDPLSEIAQRWSTILARSSELFPDVYIELYLNPTQHTEIPLKRFYRYNVVPHLNYDPHGQEIPAQVTFNGLPIEPIYTLGMDVPPSWLVRPREALYDLDNIQLGKLAPEDRIQGVQALFALDYLVVEGHARELKTVNPPRGVQLQLISVKDGSIIDDTQVVANLGYLQFKARPGTFRLEIREGRGREIYELESVGSEGWNSPSVTDDEDELTVMNFDGLTLYPRLTRKPGMERADVLNGLQGVRDEGSGNIMGNWMSKMTSFLTNKESEIKSVQKQGDGQADINIFTVASGLLYERFASIMILSVLRNTNSSVKFWFIENFLSPSFLEFIPHMAAEYGFQYELVTYKWPSWLRAQKEKQRVIWAYKILFLDVLFPMDLKKVIFVDADQIVRADLQELVDLDLHGAPYGYTPMGNDNHDMEGFRFWKTGYWHDFLDGRPYHIRYVPSLFALCHPYDLLRGSYQMLSQDPNSLANLDQGNFFFVVVLEWLNSATNQDLPNNLQAQVPIYSLHEDWLWVNHLATGSKDRLHRAKTIDLCQNPLTKEPKLSRARQIPEWEEYDSEIARFARRLAAEGKIHASVATADSHVLAGSNTAAAQPQTDVNMRRTVGGQVEA